MPNELALLGLTGLAPQPRDMPAHRVQRRLPVCALPQRELALASHLTQQLSGAAQAVVSGEEVVPADGAVGGGAPGDDRELEVRQVRVRRRQPLL